MTYLKGGVDGFIYFSVIFSYFVFYPESFLHFCFQVYSHPFMLNTNNFVFFSLRTNPLGMKGHIAQRYGELVKDLWSGSSKTLAPLRLRVGILYKI